MKKIIIDHKEYTMPKISVDNYMDYLDASEKMNESQTSGYKREHIELMCQWIVRLFGDQFTIEDLKDVDKGLDAAEIIMEFMSIDIEVAETIQKKMEKLTKNFTNGK